jgi:hypothetical protein
MVQVYLALVLYVILGTDYPALGAGNAPSDAEKKETSMENGSWWHKQFVLSAFTSVQNGDDIEKVIALLGEAGLNALESNTPLEYKAETLSPENLIRTLNACEKHNIKFFITDHKRMTGVKNPKEDELRAMVNEYKDYPALGGYYVWDEPRGHFDAVKQSFDVLRAADPSRLPLVAFLPSYGPWKHPKTYPDMARKFVETVNPPVLSFDYYAMKGSPGKYSQSASVYLDLELWSSLSLETEKPFWMYVTSCSWKSSPSMESLRLQVYSAIAYGAKGIQYFVAKSFTGRKPNFAGAPLNMDGSKSRFYDTFKAFNMEVKALGPYLMPLKLTKVMHTNPAPNGTKPFAPHLGLMAAPDNLIVSFHQGKDGKNYLFVVNKDANQNRDITLTVTPGTLLMLLNGDVKPNREGNEVSFKMFKGGGLLFEFGLAPRDGGV